MQQEINNNFSKEDEFYMKRAIELEKCGIPTKTWKQAGQMELQD